MGHAGVLVRIMHRLFTEEETATDMLLTAIISRWCLQERKEDDMDMDVDEEPMRIVRNYQRHG